MLDAFAHDLRYALRALRSNPAFTAVSIVSLALGIGANTAIFSLIDAVMLDALPVSHPEQLVQVSIENGQGFGNPIWEQLRNRQDVFSGIFAFGRWAFDTAPRGEVRNVNGQYVSGQFFETLGVRAALGRTLAPADDWRDCPGVAVLSYGFWQREYGGRRDIVGRSMSIDTHPFDIVGIAQRGFTGIEVGGPADVFAPLCAEKIVHGETSLLDTNFLPGWLQIVGRPRPGISPAQAEARLKTLAPDIFRASLPRDWRIEDQQVYLRHTLEVEPAPNGLSYIRNRYSRALFVLMAIVALVLLIACANIANLLLARGAAREREFAIRTALGCGRGRLTRQMLTESLLLSLAGAALGVLFASWGVRLLVALLDAQLDMTIDARVLVFTATVAVLTGLLFGIAPAWRGARVTPQIAMRANARGVITGGRFGLGKALVVLQVALSALLVVGAGLMLSTLYRLTSLDPGIQPGRVLVAAVDLRNTGESPERRTIVYREMLEKLRAIPGVSAVSTSNIVPMCGCKGTVDLVIDGYTMRSRADASVLFNRIGDSYFRTLGAELVAGRDFNHVDTPESPKVAIVNRSMARKYFGAANPLGRHFRIQDGTEIGPPYQIIGIVADAKYGSLREDAAPTVYIARNQDRTSLALVYFELRAANGAPQALIGPARSAIASVDRMASFEFTALSDTIRHLLRRERLLASLSAVFGALALLLAMIGLFGVISYNVARRRNEIGIRMALGAQQARVLKMIMTEVAALIVAGLVFGLGAAALTTRFIASFLYGLSPDDPATFLTVTALLAGVAAIAGYLPARRASRLDPMSALREE